VEILESYPLESKDLEGQFEE
jgi:hypothetical protein